MPVQPKIFIPLICILVPVQLKIIHPNDIDISASPTKDHSSQWYWNCCQSEQRSFIPLILILVPVQLKIIHPNDIDISTGTSLTEDHSYHNYHWYWYHCQTNQRSFIPMIVIPIQIPSPTPSWILYKIIQTDPYKYIGDQFRIQIQRDLHSFQDPDPGRKNDKTMKIPLKLIMKYLPNNLTKLRS